MRGCGMPSTTKVPLKYLFNTIYDDGTMFVQNKEDISTVDPKRSAYYDVKLDKVYMFTLNSQHNHMSLNLLEGRFYPGNFTIGDDPGPKPYKLIFYRQHIHNFNVGLDELSHEVKYCIGYTDADGVEHKILID